MDAWRDWTMVRRKGDRTVASLGDMWADHSADLKAAEWDARMAASWGIPTAALRVLW